MNTMIEDDNTRSGRKVATLIYALYALSLFTGGLCALIGVVIAYVKRGDLAGTWVSTHFRWQIRTFWFSLLWAAIGWATFWLVVGWAVWFAGLVWFIYRIVKGWLNLNDNKPMA
jgi:uncharacterized membrane protein